MNNISKNLARPIFEIMSPEINCYFFWILSYWPTQ